MATSWEAELATWREDVFEALRSIGGAAPLASIYRAVREIRGGRLPRTWEAIVRRELEYNSSDSRSYRHRFDLFRSVQGIGGGVWALRDVAADIADPPDRELVLVNRIIRDTKAVKELKAQYRDQCQLCGKTLSCADGSTYSEGHHVRPLGGDHHGTDSPSNILILCPDCHAACDLGFIRLDGCQIEWRSGHEVSLANLDYHNERLARRGAK